MRRGWWNKARLRALVEEPVAKHYAGPAVYELRFDPERKWQFDLAWPEVKVALEVEGAVLKWRTRPDGTREYVGGRHSRGTGMVADMDKYNAAADAGWCVIRVIWREVMTGYAAAQISGAIRKRTEAAP